MATTGHKPVDFSAFHNVINGELKGTRTTRHGINPATEEPNPEVPVSTVKDVEAAIHCARTAFPSWAAVLWEERAAAIRRYADALESELEGFARLLTQEQGKPLQFARLEIKDALRWLREISNLTLLEETVREDDSSRVIVRYTPLGVTVAIVPWNYPVMLACGKIGPSLITGNPVIIKPSPFTPYCSLKLAELAQQFFPAGVVQALSGDDNLGPWLTAHPGVDKISFTGSTPTGKRVMQSASQNLTRVTLELGGNDAAIVCADADIGSAAQAIASYAFLNSGQTCVAVKRIYVHESIYEKFRKEMFAFVRTLKLSADMDAFMGPVQNKMQYNLVKDLLSNARSQGYTSLASTDVPKTGYFITPTIIDNPPETSRIVQEEPFGPVVPLLSWSTEDEVLRRVNNTDMGLGASVWSSDLAKAEALARQIEAGSVWVNNHVRIDPLVPFGGHKASGIGCEWGLDGLKSFCNVQALYVKK
ncbi:aldehyde dehydrogenase [Aspergillus carlsbadensis]|nr:aldehyde dehydrogenase [Aspergillus carlsbadensis]